MTTFTETAACPIFFPVFSSLLCITTTPSLEFKCHEVKNLVCLFVCLLLYPSTYNNA